MTIFIIGVIVFNSIIGFSAGAYGFIASLLFDGVALIFLIPLKEEMDKAKRAFPKQMKEYKELLQAQVEAQDDYDNEWGIINKW